jgi:sirohydrochlorin ferrochelatase
LQLERQAHPEAEFVLARHLSGHPAMVAVVRDRIRECVSPGKVES